MSLGTFTVVPPKSISCLKEIGFDGARTAEIFQTIVLGNSFDRTMACNTCIKPVSAIKNPRMPASTARRMSSRAYRSWSIPRRRPESSRPSGLRTDPPIPYSSRGPTKRLTSIPSSAAMRAISFNSARVRSIAPLPWEAR